MAEYYIAPKSSFDATADAIREKTGSQATIEWTEDGFADAIAEISGDSREDLTIPKDVNFYDYDGRRVYSYTASEAATLTELPTNPSHAGLIAQGWNFTLVEVKSYASKYGKCDVGQMYITDNGKTRLYCRFGEDTLAPYVGFGLDGTAVIDWGDGTSTSTLSGTSLTEAVYANHTYASPGNYMISIDVTDGNAALIGTWGEGAYILRESDTKSGDSYPSSLKKVELGSNVLLEDYCFYGCSQLASISIPNGLTSLGNDAFDYNYIIASPVLPKTMTSIGDYAMGMCYGLKHIALPTSLTSMGAYAFYSDTGFEYVIIPEGVTSIENYTFYQCYSLTSVSLPTTLTSIGSNTFQGAHIKEIDIPDSVTTIGASAFANCSRMKSIHLPNSLTAVSNYMLQSCTGLTSITIPSNVTAINTGGFMGCYGLTSIFIPSNITTIDAYAFQRCSALTSVTISSGVTSIRNYAFASCSAVTEYHMLSTTPPTLSNKNAFSGISSGCIIYVPYSEDHSVLAAYQSATNWSTYASQMQEEPQ